MNQQLFDERKMAKIYAHYIYRNTVIEDFHADCQRMNKELYEKMYKVVYSKIKKGKL